VTQAAAKENPAMVKRREGLDLLEKARLEIRAGQYNNARRLAEAVFTGYPGPHGLQDEARRVLASIDTEEHNQRLIQANRRFLEAHEAFTRRDYALARTILANVDERLLSAENQSRLRELATSKEMQPGAIQQMAAAQPGGPTGRAVATDQQPGAAPAPGGTEFDRLRAIEKIQFDKLRVEGLAERNRAQASSKAGDYAGALEILRAYAQRLEASALPQEQLALLIRPVQRSMDELRTLREQKAFEDRASNPIVMDGTRREGERNLQTQKRQKKIEEMVQQCRALVGENKFDEAVVLAERVKAEDPDNVAADALLIMSKHRREIYKGKTQAEANSDFRLKAWHDAERLGPYVDGINTAVHFEKNVTTRNQHRKDYGGGIYSGYKNERERLIEQRLNTPVSLNFINTPLRQAIQDLHEISGGLNVVPDTLALTEAGINMERQLSLKVENISLKSALNMLLRQVNLTYIIKDEALQITTEEHAKGKGKIVTYPVADLVVPVPDHPMPVVCDFYKFAADHRPSLNPSYNPGGAMPFMGPNTLMYGQQVGAAGGQPGGAALNASGGQHHHGHPPAGKAPGSTIEDMLIKLITSTIDPHSWDAVGGKGTIQYFPLGLALVINQTQDIQEQVQDLLQALRRLQDLEVAIEMRLVSVSEAFFERIGLDFDININAKDSRFEPQLIANQFRPPGFVNAFRPDTFFAGLTPAGTFTPDLGVPLRNSSFDFSLPPFGGYPGTLGADGGLTLGLAFLSDIQVFMLLEAAQGDRRVNVMQAPKITVFNGQTASINVTDAQFFLTQINVVPFGSQLVFQPQNSPVFFGIFLTVTPVVSADRRFVRLNLSPQLNNLFSATVPLVPIQTPVNSLYQDGLQSVQPVIFQTFFQQPAVGSINLNTTVVIPDGGTVLLGGLKALSEARNEFGPPILSKIPYINRLFKNVGYGRETQSLMILVTARIIINEEEEQIYLGNLPPIPR
jgi:type II secretory pathway component GspD/PulD (secretin)